MLKSFDLGQGLPFGITPATWRTWGVNGQGRRAKRALTRGGATPPPYLVHFGREPANLINTAQVTPPRRRVMHRSYVVGLCARALAAGGIRRSLLHVHWDVSAGCRKPVLMEFEGRSNPVRVRNMRNALTGQWQAAWVDDDHKVYRKRESIPAMKEAPMLLTLEAKCRACPVCLRQRARLWRSRAEAEYLAAPRTWFGTLTLRPEEHARMLYQCEARLGRGGTSYGDLAPEERYRELHTEICRDVTKWLKRIRKESGARLRYCLVAEEHKTGLEHMHCLIHEVNGGGMVKERTLRQQWTLGFSRWNLVHDKGAAGYVTKYLMKSNLARVRASIDYGYIEVGDIGGSPSVKELPPKRKSF